MWFKRKIDMLGAAYFSGRLAPSLQSLDGLRVHGVSIAPTDPGPDALWEAELSHPEWGTALLRAPRELFPLDRVAVSCDGRLSPEDKELAHSAERALFIKVTPQHDDVLRDRKSLLRYLGALLHEDGLLAFDAAAEAVWTREHLSEELAHDAPLDITQILVLHQVDMGDGIWLHSHGLSELGFVDFDILRPADGLTHEQIDLVRALAFAIVEGHSSGVLHVAAPGGEVELVDASAFMQRATARDRSLRESDSHTEKRVVCCEPEARRGFLARLFRRGQPEPSRLFSRGVEEGRQLVQFSRYATELGAIRARESVELFGSLREEFAQLKLPALAKLGYTVDEAEDDEQREHLWFEIHDVTDKRIDGTLINEPFRIARMRAGQRATHDLDLLTDWAIMTPVGQITPRSLEIARRLRSNRDEIAKALADAGGSWE
jgi:uncharacterized protein YegJ (DUF2314 family)